jgi:hypothetical protein
MTRQFGFIAILFCNWIAFGQALQLNRVLAIAGASLESGQALTVDRCGNLFATGIFNGTIDIDPGVSVTILSTGSDPRNVYVAKFNSTGTMLWYQQFAGMWLQTSSIDLDMNGNIGIAAIATGTVDVDPGAFVYAIGTANANSNIYFKLNPGGQIITGFAIPVGSSGGGLSLLKFDPNNDIIITRLTGGTVDLDAGPSVYTVACSGLFDFFICKYTASGTFVWGESGGGNGSDVIRGLSIDHSGNILCCGVFNAVADLDPGPSVVSFTAGNSLGDGFVLRLQPNGTLIWAKQFTNLGGTGSICFDVCVDAVDNIYLCGAYSGTVDIDPGPATQSYVSAGTYDLFIVKLIKSGLYSWGYSVGGGTGAIVPPGAITVGNSAVYMSGQFQQTVDFDPGPSVFTLTSAGSIDAFVTSFDTTGVFGWAGSVSGPSPIICYDVVTDGSGAVYITGDYMGNCDFDPGAGQFTLTAIGGKDAFISKLSQCRDAPEASCKTPIKLCSGHSTTLTATGGSNLSWSSGTTTTSVGSGSTYFTPTLTPGSFTYIASSVNCPSATTNNSAVFIVTVSAPPIVSIVPSTTTICPGQTVTLSANGANSYTWNTQQQSAVITVTATSSVNYSVTGTDTVTSCSSTAAAFIGTVLCTGIDKPDLNYPMYYPQPANEELYVMVTNTTLVNITDVLGKNLLRCKLEVGVNSINAKDLEPGIYNITFSSALAQTAGKLIIVR